jgi:serine/threonine protein kinase
MKCVKDLSYSGMFTKENSRKFDFKRIIEKDSADKPEETIRFAGQQNKLHKVRNDFLKIMAKASVLERKNELGLILDLISACLDVDPKKRPTIQGLLNSPIF